jgi:hypothetical protein
MGLVCGQLSQFLPLSHTLSHLTHGPQTISDHVATCFAYLVRARLYFTKAATIREKQTVQHCCEDFMTNTNLATPNDDTPRPEVTTCGIKDNL